MVSHTVQASRARVRAAGMLLSGLLMACSGTIEPGENGPNGPGFHGGAANSGGAATSGGGGASGGGSGAGGVGAVPGDPRIAQRVWRLSPEQLNAELHALFGDDVPELAIPETAGEYGITNIAANAVVDLGNASLFVDGARSVGTWVVSQGAAALRCSDYGSDGC